MSNITLYNGDCLEEMKKISDASVDLILCDLPYGTTACKWDSCINIEKLWKEYKRIIKPEGNILLFGDGSLFTAKLILSNEKMYSYNWYWKKPKPSGSVIARFQPMRSIETISVFKNSNSKYYPIMTPGKHRVNISGQKEGSVYKNINVEEVKHYELDGYYPTNVLEFKTISNSGGKRLHPSQKPVDLLEYLIKTYTLDGDTILDNCMGSGSTGVAAKNLNRDFIGIEMDEAYFNIAKDRIEKS